MSDPEHESRLLSLVVLILKAKHLIQHDVLLYSEWPHNFTEPEPHLNQFSQIKCSNLDTELNVMKKIKQNYQIQIRVQIRLVRNIKSKSNPNPSKIYKSAGFMSKSIFISATSRRWLLETQATSQNVIIALFASLGDLGEILQLRIRDWLSTFYKS